MPSPSMVAAKKIRLVRQNCFPELCEGLNKAINRELHASYFYRAMSYFFRKPEVHMMGFSSHFRSVAEDKRRNALTIIDYLSRRGQEVTLSAVAAPYKGSKWSSTMDALSEAVEVERWLNAKLIALHYRALLLHDPSVLVFLEDSFVEQQAAAVRARASLVLRARNGGKTGLAFLILDKSLQEGEGEETESLAQMVKDYGDLLSGEEDAILNELENMNL